LDDRITSDIVQINNVIKTIMINTSVIPKKVIRVENEYKLGNHVQLKSSLILSLMYSILSRINVSYYNAMRHYHWLI
jgi:hypothetical protein